MPLAFYRIFYVMEDFFYYKVFRYSLAFKLLFLLSGARSIRFSIFEQFSKNVQLVYGF